MDNIMNKIIAIILMLLLVTLCHGQGIDVGVGVSGAWQEPGCVVMANYDANQYLTIGASGTAWRHKMDADAELKLNVNETLRWYKWYKTMLCAGVGIGYTHGVVTCDDHHYHTYHMGVEWATDLEGMRWQLWYKPEFVARSHNGHIGLHRGRFVMSAGVRWLIR